MSKKTGIYKVLGRTDYVVVHKTVKMKNSAYKEIVSVLDFTYKP